MATKKKVAADLPEISTVMKPDKSWSFKWNDERVTYEQYIQLNEDHKQWVREQEKKIAEPEVPTRRKKK